MQIQSSNTNNTEEFKLKIIEHIELMLEKDISDNKAIGKNGALAILSLVENKSEKVNILTHCNTGSLATAGYGTALGVVRCLHEMGRLEHCYFTETRPFNQGARLTSYELLHEKIDSTMICDSAIGELMKQKKIHAIVVGADHVTIDGYTANKIGTYNLGVVGKYHGVAMFVAAPTNSITPNNHTYIHIEQRSHTEMTQCQGIQVAPLSTQCWNPSFDVTPGELIHSFITEKGVFPPNQIHKLFQ